MFRLTNFHGKPVFVLFFFPARNGDVGWGQKGSQTLDKLDGVN